MFAKLQAKMVSDAKNAWKWLSMQFMALAASLTGLEEAVKQGWIGLPDDVKATMGTWVPRAIGAAVLVAIVGRLWKQSPQPSASSESK